MIRFGLVSAAVVLFAAVASSVALFAVPDASEAEQNATGTPVAQTVSLNQSQVETASETQYSNGPNGDGGIYPPVIPAPDMPQPDMPQPDMPQPDMPQSDMSQSDMSQSDMSQSDMSQSDMSQSGTPATDYDDFYAQWLAREGDAAKVSKVKDTPSEGSAPGVRAPARAISVMEPPAPYSQTVDNASQRRFFSKRAWKKSSGGARHYGKDYEYIKPRKDAPLAWFRVKIPTAGHYTVYARWPAAERNNPAARFHIDTASGLKKVEVNQRKDGGTWMRLGAYKMEAGNSYSVRVAGRSEDKGRVVADAVRVVRGTQVAHPREAKRNKGGGATAGEAAGGKATASEVIRRARTHIGTPYRHSPPQPCEAYRSEDCSCFTSLVFDKWLTLPDDPVQQWRVGRSIEKSALRPGDLVFFKEAGESNPITHVGIYSGSGNIIHSSSYWGRVVERPMQYVSGYYGAKRLS